MIILPNGCSCSELSVHPTNWNTGKVSVKKDWYIHYRFYDPMFKEKYPNGKLRIIKGMNKYKDIPNRQKAVKEILDNELDVLKNDGYNPISQKFKPPINYEVTTDTPIIRALTIAFQRKECEPSTKKEISYALRDVIASIEELNYKSLLVSEVKRKHVKIILDHVGSCKKRFSPCSYNRCRSYLMILFDELLELDVVENNPVKDIKKKVEIVKIREVLTLEQRSQVDKLLKNNYYNFWRFVHIFFHSGSRITELLGVKVRDVDLVNQRCKYLILKGRQKKEVYRAIKDTALSLWVELLENASTDDYIFSINLMPGISKIRRDQITKRWYKYVKKKLNITADFYSLKHLNTDETAALLGIDAAAAHNSHTSTAITLKHYATGEKDRQQERIKKINNGFA